MELDRDMKTTINIDGYAPIVLDATLIIVKDVTGKRTILDLSKGEVDRKVSSMVADAITPIDATKGLI